MNGLIIIEDIDVSQRPGKVALAGVITRDSADCLTLFEVAATGRLTTKKTLPITVATKT